MSPLLGWIFKLIGIAIGAGAVVVGTKVYKMKHDTVIEEFVEEEIKDQTGLDIDLTPEDSDPDEDKPSKTKL